MAQFDFTQADIDAGNRAVFGGRTLVQYLEQRDDLTDEDKRSLLQRASASSPTLGPSEAWLEAIDRHPIDSDFSPAHIEEAEAARAEFVAGAAWHAENSKYGQCASCGQPFELHQSPTGDFRSHFEHPDDDHDVVLTLGGE